jgi:regulatory protein
MDFLSRREHSKKELFNKLSKRVDNLELLNQEIDRLAKDGLQSDERFSEAYIRSQTQAGYGPIKIKMELAQKGISINFLDKKFSELEINWEDEIKELLLRKFPKTKHNFEEEKTKAKAINFLQRRGFDFDLCYRQVKTYS